MKRKRLVAAGAGALCFGGVALAETFTWTDDGSNTLWSTCGNWIAFLPDPDPCYPSETTADVVVDGDPLVDDNVSLDAATVTVDDVTFKGTFTIDNNRSSVSRVKMDSLRVIGGSSGATLTLRKGDMRLRRNCQKD